MDHGFAGLDESGEMENAVEGMALGLCLQENVFNQRPVGQIPYDEFHSRRQQIATAMAEVVEDDGLVTVLGQETGDSTTYVPGATCYQHFHE
jgi:hypothetical protein